MDANERARTTRYRSSANTSERKKSLAIERYATATVTGVQATSKSAVVAVVEGVTVSGRKDADTVAIARVGKPATAESQANLAIAGTTTATIESYVPASATVTVGSAAGEPATARITASADSKPTVVDIDGRSARLLTETVAGSPLQVGEAVVTSRLSQPSDVLLVNIHKQFPDDYSVVYSRGPRLSHIITPP